MAVEGASATETVNAPAEVILGVLTDPAKHSAIDGTGWSAAAESVRQNFNSFPPGGVRQPPHRR